MVFDLEGNSRPIEEIQEGDWVLAHSEFDPHGPLELKRVEEKHVRTTLRTALLFSCSILSCSRAALHPFYVPAQERFVPAGELQVGDQLVNSQGVLAPIESISNLNEITTVYNLRVADQHTYFVGGALWGWDVWVHNAQYDIPGVVSLKQVGQDSRYFQMAQKIRSEVAKIPGLRSAFRRPPATPNSDNIAFATGTIDNNAVNIKASSSSQGNNPKGFARTISENIRKLLLIPKNMGVNRVSDTEAKILGHLLRNNKENSNGKVVIYTEREPCAFCNPAITRFTKLRPHIQVSVRYTFPHGGT